MSPIFGRSDLHNEDCYLIAFLIVLDFSQLKSPIVERKSCQDFH